MNCFGRVGLILVTALVIGGCGGSTSTTTDVTELPAEPTSPPPAAPAPPPAPPNVADAIASSTAARPTSDQDQPEPADEPSEPAEDMEREKADVGAGKRGRNYGGGIVSTPVRSYFRVRQRAVFQIQLPQAERMYKAEHDGQGPASHEDYMREIIAANDIALPELPEGETYFYDAEAGELMIQRPKK